MTNMITQEVSDTLHLDDEWQQIVQFLPPGWQEQARKLGAIRRNSAYDA